MNNYLKMLSVAGIASIPQLAGAAGPTLSDIFVNSGITAAGYADASYTAFFHKTGGTTTGNVVGHAFDTNDNTFAVNQTALTLSYLPTSGFGALVNVVAGEDAKVINSAYSGGSSDFALTQAFVQYATGNLTVIGGRFVTLAGAEVIDDTKNANISRSLLFQNAEPLVHTGLRASYKLSDQFTGTLGVNNTALAAGGNAADTDKHKTLEAGATFTPTSAISIALADYYSLDGNGPGQTKNNFLDLVGSWQVTSALQLVLNGDYVRTYGPSAGNTTTSGVAAYAVYQINDQWKASVRGENLRISTSGTSQVHVSEFTATADYAPTKYFDLLAEGRIDYGSLGTTGVGYSNIFAGGSGGGRKSQPEVLLKAIFKFGTPTGT